MFWFPVVLALEITNKSLKILQFTDLHYGEGDTQDRLNTQIQENLLK